MKPPTEFVKIVDRKRYSVATATLIASDAFWDGHNFERHNRNTFLYKTRLGAFFTVTLSQWRGEDDSLGRLTVDRAISLYEGRLSVHEIDYSEAFPGVVVEDA